jgi:uncharacterized membrane protein
MNLMASSQGPIIDMTPDGDFVTPPKPTIGTILLRLAAFGVFLCIAALAFWTILFMIPVLLVLGVVGYFVARSQLRRHAGGWPLSK